MTGRRNMLPVLIAAAAAVTASVDAADSVTSVDAISSVAAPLADLHASGSPRHLAGCDFDQLLNNGDFENGDITPWYKDGKWGGHSVQLVEGGYNNSSYALISKSRYSYYGPQTKLYNLEGCVNVGDLLVITGKVKLISDAGEALTCNTKQTNRNYRCPPAYLIIKDSSGNDKMHELGIINYADLTDNQADGWMTISGQMNLGADFDGNKLVRLSVKNTNSDGNIMLDDFIVSKEEEPRCMSPVRNPSFDNGDLSFWYGDLFTKSKIKPYSPGASGNPSDYALRSYGRAWKSNAPIMFLDNRCLIPGTNYRVTAMLKIVDSDGNPKACDPAETDPNSNKVCPAVGLKGFDCPDSSAFDRSFNEIDLGTWDADGFNRFQGTLTIKKTTPECSRAYIMVGRDLRTDWDLIIDDVEVTFMEDTSAPSDAPSASPTFPPTISPTNKPTAFPTVSNVIKCPEATTGQLEVQAGPVMLAKSDGLCLLIKAEVGSDGTIGRIAPVARSFDGHDWTIYGGEFAVSFLQDWDFDHHSVGSQITLPELNENERYLLKSYTHSLSNDEAIARFLNTVTFGVTADEITGFKDSIGQEITKENAASWIQQQIEEPVTSHRAYLRKRSNARLTEPRVQYTPDHPCDVGSRWRMYTFSVKDGHQYWYSSRRVGLVGDGPYVITLDGHPRTTVSAFPWKKQSSGFVFDQVNGHRINCWDHPEEWINGTWEVRYNNNCEHALNPPVYFDDTTKTMLTNPVVQLPDIGNGLEVIDTHKKSNGQEFILVNGLDDEVCSQLPDIHYETEEPMFGQLPDGTWLQFDPHFDVMENTVENPLTDGGGTKLLLTNDYTQCSNVARTRFNEQGCILSREPTSCRGTGSRSTILIDLNADSIIAMHNITGKYIYAITNLPLRGDSDSPIDSVCNAGTKSRWEIKPSVECTPTILDNETMSVLTNVLSNSPDENAFIRDITFPSDEECGPDGLALEDASIVIGSECFQRVHPDHMTIYDMSYCAEDMNPCLFDLPSDGHPIKDPMDIDMSVFFDYLGQSHSFFDEQAAKFSKVGRFGDTINFIDLSPDLSLDEIATYFGSIDSGSGGGVVVCGSRDEVANDPSFGEIFDISTGKDVPSRKIVANRESVWAMVALEAKDQLRQRIAWALAQLLVVVPDQVNSSGGTHAEVFLHYYDTFVHHAFGNYGDILREVTFSPQMGENLSYLYSKSGAYNFENNGKFTFADENYAREIMQLFSVGLYLLNIDGTEKLDENGEPIFTYTNDEIMSFARIFTGFVRQPPRGNSEEIWFGRNVLDFTTIEPTYRDRFPKHDLTGGYIGDGYPLCVDLPPKMFLRKGATYKLLGDNPRPQAFEDSQDLLNDPYIKRFVLDVDSPLRAKLCNAVGDECQYDVVVTLDSNLEPFGQELLVDEPRVVQVGDVFYEYVRPACVDQFFYSNPMRVTYINRYWHSLCANPKLPVASEACLFTGNKPTRKSLRYSKYVFDQERVTFATAQARCEEDGLTQSWFHFIEGIENHKKGFHWTDVECKVNVKVNPNGLVSLVYDVNGASLHPNANLESRNYFKVYWKDGVYPKNDADGDGGNSCGNGACSPLEEGGCLCGTSTSEGKVFSKMPPSSDEVFAQLYIGAYDPSAYDEGTYTIKEGDGVKAYLVNNEYTSDTVFEVVDDHGKVRLFKNSKELVTIDGSSFSFRNTPSFMSILNQEATVRDAIHEVNALIDHLLYHPNTAPFIALRLIQRFVTSNPTPEYVKVVATAFKTGKYDTFGSGEYGDLAATMSAVLLEPDALSAVLDADPFHGFIREPLLKTIAFMRSMELELVPKKKALELAYPFKRRIGQMAHSFDSVFSFFLPEFVPTGKPGAASLRSPEAMLVDMPKITGLINGLFSTIKYGVSACNDGFGETSSKPCKEGDFSNAVAKLSYEPRSGDADTIVSELATLLTSGRLSAANKQVIKEAYSSMSNTAAALRLAQQLIVSSPEFHTSNIVQMNGESRTIPTNPEPSGVPYKALIFVMLQGGADSFNMLIPHTCSSKDMYKEYSDMRGSIAISPKSSLLAIDSSTSDQVCESFGMHPKLSAAHQLYKDGDLVWFANAGVLYRPVDKSNYKKGAKSALFAHNSMQREVQCIDPDKTDVETGVLGRLSDALIYQQQFSVEKYNIYKGSQSLDGHHGSQPFIVDAEGIPEINRNPSMTNMKDIIKSMNQATESDSGVFADLFSDLFLNSLHDNELLTSALINAEISTAFGDDSLGKAFEMVAKIISTRELRGVDRDIFFIPHSNWDAHNLVLWNLNTNLESLDNAIGAFSREMKAKGLWDSTTIIQSSEFGRSLEPNGGDGTDHAWGGNYMMMGGSVKGGKIHGKYPATLTTDGPDILERGRIIPTMSWEEIMGPVAEWAGVSPDSVVDVCPNIKAFEPVRMSVTDLFD